MGWNSGFRLGLIDLALKLQWSSCFCKSTLIFCTPLEGPCGSHPTFDKACLSHSWGNRAQQPCTTLTCCTTFPTLNPWVVEGSSGSLSTFHIWWPSAFTFWWAIVYHSSEVYMLWSQANIVLYYVSFQFHSHISLNLNQNASRRPSLLAHVCNPVLRRLRH